MRGTNASCSHTPNSFERSDHIVLEFLVSQIVRARTITCAKPPPRLAQVYGHVSESFSARHITFAMCRAGTNSDTWQNTCAILGGGFAQVKRALAHDMGKPKTMAAKRKCMCTSLALALVVPQGTTDQEGLGP